MIKKKFSFEKAVDIILNDEYEDNMIFQHLDYQLTESELAKVSGSQTPKRPKPKSGSQINFNENRVSQPKPSYNFKKRQIFDEDEPILISHVQKQKSRRKIFYKIYKSKFFLTTLCFFIFKVFCCFFLIKRGNFKRKAIEISKKIIEKRFYKITS